MGSPPDALPSPLSRAFRLSLLILTLTALSSTVRADEETPGSPSQSHCQNLFSRIVKTGTTVRKGIYRGALGLVRHLAPPRTLTPQEYAALKERPVEAYFVDSNGRLLTAPDKVETKKQPVEEAVHTPTAQPLRKRHEKQKPRKPLELSLGEAVRAQESHLDGLKLNLEATAKFLQDVDLYLHNRRVMQGFSHYGKFKDWWHNRTEVYLNKPVVELLINERMTVGDFVDHLHLQYLAVLVAQKNEWMAFRYAKQVLRNPLAAGAAASVAYASAKLIGFIWQLMVLGPGVQMVNAYTEPVVQPLSNTARQRGAMDLAEAAQSLQEFLSGKDELGQFKQELETLTEDLKGLTPEEARERWEEFELMYFRIFQRYQQTLPLHLRQGRQLFKEFALFNPMYLASAMADFDVQYWTHHRALKELEQEIDSQGGIPSEAQARELTVHRRQMDGAESRMASTLAAWKMYEFIFPEFSRSPVNSNYRATLKGHYDRFRENLRFELYQEQFGDQMDTMLRELEFHYQLQTRLENVKEKIENPPVAPSQPPVKAPLGSGEK